MNWTNGINYNIGVQTRLNTGSIPWMPCCARRSRHRIRGEQHDGGLAGGRRDGGHQFRRRFAERRVAGLRKSGAACRTARSFSQTWSRFNVLICPVIVNHYNVWPVFDVYANVDRRDLGGVGADVRKIMREEEAQLAPRHVVRSAGDRLRPCNRPSFVWDWG